MGFSDTRNRRWQTGARLHGWQCAEGEIKMRKQVFAIVLFIGGILVGLGSSEILRAQVPAYVTKQIAKTDLQNLPGQEALLFVSEWQPASACLGTYTRTAMSSHT
jgi:hypothetical protein